MNVLLSLFSCSVGSPKDGINLEVLIDSQDESERADGRRETKNRFCLSMELPPRLQGWCIAMHKKSTTTKTTRCCFFPPHRVGYYKKLKVISYLQVKLLAIYFIVLHIYYLLRYDPVIHSFWISAHFELAALQSGRSVDS